VIELIVTDEQADQMRSGDSPVVVRDAHGEFLGFVTPHRIPDELDLQVMEKIRERQGKPTTYHTTAQVLERLRQLEAQECNGK
jgi:hypothetical protein